MGQLSEPAFVFSRRRRAPVSYSIQTTYNSRPLAPEVLVDGSEPRLIRRRQRIDELLALEATGSG